MLKIEFILYIKMRIGLLLINILFITLKFKRCTLATHLYVYREHRQTVRIVLYVDDLLLIGNDEDKIQQTQ